MRKTILAAMLLCLGGLALMGAGPLDLAFRSPVGGTLPSMADEDTFVIVFSPETLVGDTFAVSTATQLPADVARTYFLNDVLKGRGAQSWRDDDGDAATFVKLGALGETDFAYANIANYSTTAADTFGYINASGDRITIQSSTSLFVDGVRFLDLSFPQPLRKSELVYIPFEEYIPAGATIISATQNVSSASAPMLLTYTDTIIAQPLHPDWDKWMLVKDVGTNDNVAHASWSMQEDTDEGLWTGTRQYPWVPDLDYLPKLWDVSKVSDWTTNTGADVPEKSNFAIGLTNTVQAFVNGTPNTGYMVNLADFGSFTMSVAYFKWDASTNATRRMPAVIVKYTTRSYKKRFGSSEWALVVGTDDAIKACNDSMTTIFANRGMKYTINAANTFLDGVGFGTTADLLRWHDTGAAEIASHTLNHPNPLGMNKFTIANPPYSASDTIGASWDSLRVEMSPEWMYTRADALGRDMRDSPNYAKSIALPNNTWNPWAVVMANKIGYNALRVGSVGSTTTYGIVGNIAPATLGAANTDTAVVAYGNRKQRAPRNMVLLPTSMIVDRIVGLKANTSATEAQVKNNMRRAAWQVAGDGRNLLHLFFHDFKTSPTNPSYSEGVDPEEMRWMLDVVTEFDGRTMTQSEVRLWEQATSTAIATPASYGQDALFKATAPNELWFKPDGIDRRWIRGVK